MFRMIEVVGSSPAGYSDAVKRAVSQVHEMGERVHFFEVIEERGAMRNGTVEFQAKVKVAVELSDHSSKTPAPAAPKGSCPTCLKPAKEGHLCVPVGHAGKTCDWCGALIADERHLCDDKVKDLTYICNSCGRTAVSAEHLCNPRKIAGSKKKKSW